MELFCHGKFEFPCVTIDDRLMGL